jgi:hypothetical protein
MYSVAPSTDFNGFSVAKTWSLGERELTLDAYSGRAQLASRFWLRDGAPTLYAAGANFIDIDVRASGAVLTLRANDSQLRAGLHRTTTRRQDGERLPVSYPFVPLAPGLGYYQVSNLLPGPGAPSVDALRNTVLAFGLEQPLGGGWRVIAEFVRNEQHDTEVGSDTRGGYVALLRRFGDLTPYASLGRLRSSDTSLDWYRRLTGSPLPVTIPGADAINAGQRTAAETIYAIDQRSLAFGASWAMGTAQKLKFEWMRTRIGQVTRLVDTSPGSPTPHDTNVDVWSVNYNFSF